jgi:hypothetical protein
VVAQAKREQFSLAIFCSQPTGFRVCNHCFFLSRLTISAFLDLCQLATRGQNAPKKAESDCSFGAVFRDFCAPNQQDTWLWNAQSREFYVGSQNANIWT